jgi:hypothetical protein
MDPVLYDAIVDAISHKMTFPRNPKGLQLQLQKAVTGENRFHLEDNKLVRSFYIFIDPNQF